MADVNQILQQEQQEPQQNQQQNDQNPRRYKRKGSVRRFRSVFCSIGLLKRSKANDAIALINP